MDAPFWELVIRAAAVAASAFAFVCLWRLWILDHAEHHPVRWLTGYLATVAGLLMINRIYVLWVGMQHDETGLYAIDTEPMVRAVGTSLLILLLMGAGLTSVFRIRHRGGS